MARSPRCSSCHRPILWALTTEGNRIPLDPTPGPDGKIILTGRDDDGVMIVRVIKKNDPAFEPSLFDEKPAGHDGLRWTSHFATCPNANKHRRR